MPILQRLARKRPPKVGPVLLALCQVVTQGWVRLDPEVCKLLWHLVTRWHDLVCSQRYPDIHVSTNRPEGGLGASTPGPG